MVTVAPKKKERLSDSLNWLSWFRVQNFLSRRNFLKASAAGALGLAFPIVFACRRTGAGESSRYSGLKTSQYLGEVQVETTIVDRKVFTEGPAVDRAGNVLFTNIPVSKILKWNPRQKKLSVFRENSNRANGLLFNRNGNLFACEGGVGRVTRTDMKTGKISVLAETYNGLRLAPPNDLAIDAKDHIYFTSRPGSADPKQGNVNSVYRIDPDGRLHQILASPDVHMPNGLVTSPDDQILYLIEADPNENRNRNIKAYHLTETGTVTNERILFDFYPGRGGDGMCIDAEGNLYVAAGLHKLRNTSETLDTKPGIHVISPEGKLLAFAGTPEDTISNCTFGGEDLKTLYVTCGTMLLCIRTKIPGKSAYRPEV